MLCQMSGLHVKFILVTLEIPTKISIHSGLLSKEK